MQLDMEAASKHGGCLKAGEAQLAGLLVAPHDEQRRLGLTRLHLLALPVVRVRVGVGGKGSGSIC